MFRVGLTGNIGSGKSVVAGIFEALGVPVFHADEVSKAHLSSPEVVSFVATRFGVSVLTPEGTIDRKKLASIVFSEPRALAWLNELLHPRVREDFRQWAMKHAGHPYVIQEAAIIFESGIRDEYDCVIHVSCPKETAIDRVVRRDLTDGRSVLQRMQYQWEDSEKARLSDYVILNDGTEALIPQVLEIHRVLSEGGTKGNDDVASRSTDA